MPETRSGNIVVGLEHKPKNSNGKTVTFPWKGSIVRLREGTFETYLEYQIWTEDGRAYLDGEHPDDLVLTGE